MITNEVQYRATKAHLRQFEEAAANLEQKIDESSKLRSGAVSSFEASSLAELATLLIPARIAPTMILLDTVVEIGIQDTPSSWPAAEGCR